jgi:hypothetical protein
MTASKNAKIEWACQLASRVSMLAADECFQWPTWADTPIQWCITHLTAPVDYWTSCGLMTRGLGTIAQEATKGQRDVEIVAASLQGGSYGSTAKQGQRISLVAACIQTFAEHADPNDIEAWLQTLPEDRHYTDEETGQMAAPRPKPGRRSSS